VSIAGSLPESSPERAMSASRLRVAHATASQPALRLKVSGLSIDERGVLLSILQVLEHRTERRWQLSDAAAPDLLLRVRGDGPDDAHAALRGTILREGEASADPDTLALQLPLRVMSVLDVLDAAHDRLRQREARVATDAAPTARPAAVPGGEPIETEDGKALASALARLIDRRLDQTLRVRILGHGTLYLCPSSRAFCIDFAAHELLPALQQHRFVLTTISPDSDELRQQAPLARPIDEALWSIGMAAAWEQQPDAGARFRLRRWPDLARLPHRASHIQACAALATRALGFDELRRACAMGTAELGHFLHACTLCGLLEVTHESTAFPPPVDAAPRGGALSGLFDRLRRRLGL
jgi:hypothetical protein